MNNLEKNISDDFRKLIISKFLIYASLTVTSSLSLYSFSIGNMKLFYADTLIFITLLFIFLYFRRKSILLVAKSITIICSVAVLFVIYINEGNDNVMFWAYTFFSPLMFLFGFKKGALITSIFSVILFALCLIWLGTSITYPEYIRFVFIGVILAVTSYLYEHTIYITMNELKNVNNKLLQISKIDGLTELYNRRFFDEVFPTQIKIAKREKKLLVFAMIDIDFFKNFNDSYGHLAGDNVLKEIAKSFKENMKRPDDFVFRIGGEEFGILFKTDDKIYGVKLIEKVCKSVEDLKIAHSGNDASPYVTVSIGLFIEKPHKYLKYDDIYQSSDDALYQAKLKGKNRVEIA